MKYKKIALFTIVFMFLSVCSLSAISAANNTINNSDTITDGIAGTGDGDTLTLQGGIYNKTDDYGITIDKNITIQGNTSTNQVIIDAQGLSRIFSINSNLNVRFINITFTNGIASDGGAIYIYQGTMTIINCTFINNTDNGGGGAGGAVYNSNGNMNISGSSFTNNKCTSTFSNGGAVYNNMGNMSISSSSFTNNNVGGVGGVGGAVYNSWYSNMNITDSNFTNNNANSTSGVNGGAVYINYYCNVSITGSNFINNSASSTGANAHGGAVYINSNCNVSITGSNFTNNTASTVSTANHDANGGAVHINSNCNVSITGSNFINNTVSIPNQDANGGAVYNNYYSNMNITDSNFTNNTATNGGAVNNQDYSNMSISGSSFINNTATSYGGAVYNDDISNMNISGSSFTNNTAAIYGGGVFTNGSDGVIRDSNFTGNSHAVVFNGTNNSLTGSDILNNQEGIIILDGNGNHINYNRIFNNNSTGYDMENSGTDTNADWNWWGKNDISSSISGLNTNNHYILNITNSSSLDDVHFDDNVSFYLLVLNTTLDNTNVTNLPDFVITGTFNGKAYNSSRNESFNHLFTILSVGTQNVTASLDSLDNQDVFMPFSATKAFTNSTIVVNPDSVNIDENITISGVLANHTGVTSVNVTVDGKLFTNVTVDASGYWELNYTTNRTGTDLEVIVSFGNENYNDFSNATTFTVNMSSTNSTIVVNPNPVNIGENVTISGVLANHTGVTSVNVTVDGKLFTNVTVDNGGYWELNYTTNRSGTDLEVIVSFAGNENYMSFSNSTSFNVTKLAINSTVNIPNDVKVGKTITISGVLVDENGNSVANVPITVTVGGKAYSLTTDSNGRWSLTYKPTHTGSVNSILDYAGNDKYFSYTNTTTFNVVKGKAIVDVDVIKNSDGSVDVIVTVTDEDGDPIPGYEVSVDLDGKHIADIFTDVYGVRRIHIPSSELSDGRHVITVSSGDVNYDVNPVSVEFEIQNNNNDTNNNKTNNNPVASATMKNTGMPIIAIILVLLTIFGISIRRKED
ncbi:putative outer membrane protein pmp6 precursor [Methanobrevibacter cuticularis]|uniref:Putative outer membrane protein pmp6 n=1 Tax=Methanobrevibacter cuticularis TaxID=47311 RepID=A0A166CJ32_9EURY|nr:carboxypeptidase-like regulatory domain-containing protein [Methanobrevibacter cuticularis]KZX14565.1 putative outer membrane protein pmp6 precursor [Methanobrevibacter cuticularis]